MNLIARSIATASAVCIEHVNGNLKFKRRL